MKIYRLNEIEEKDVFLRCDTGVDVSQPVREMIERVRKEGDQALYALTEQFDGAKLETLAVSKHEIEDALQKVEKEFLEILR